MGGLVLVLPALRRPYQLGGGLERRGRSVVAAGRPLRGRRRARRAAPALRALLAQGALRPRPGQGRRALPEAGAPGHDPRLRRREDVQEPRQRRQPRRHRRAVRRRRDAPLRDVHGTARGSQAVADGADLGRRALPAARLPPGQGRGGGRRGGGGHGHGRGHAEDHAQDHQEGDGRRGRHGFQHGDLATHGLFQPPAGARHG
mmetsp:Transcript_66760/g.161183  ORF Transcript_66760/g.161183 Transcript_66760/m.161183 type:complete len:202 (+) Transcript_66760:1821-2426(+)